MWHQIKDRTPTIIITAVIITAASAFVFNRNAARQEDELASLRQKNKSLENITQESRRQFEEATKLLRQSVAQAKMAFSREAQSGHITNGPSARIT